MHSAEPHCGGDAWEADAPQFESLHRLAAQQSHSQPAVADLSSMSACMWTLQIKAVLCAALYPNVAMMDDEKGPMARPGWHDGQGVVAVHPSSVNHPLLASQYQRPYLIYLEKASHGMNPSCTTYLCCPATDAAAPAGWQVRPSAPVQPQPITCSATLLPSHFSLPGSICRSKSICTLLWSCHVVRLAFHSVS